MKKTLNLICACSVGLVVSANATLIINSGEMFVYSFEPDDLSYQYDMLPDHNDVQLYFEISGSYEVETHFTVNLYSDTLSDPQFYSEPFSVGTTLIGSINYFNWDAGNNKPLPVWTDSQGIVEFNVTQGVLMLEEITVGTIVNDKYYSSTIPEPSSIALVAVGSGIFYLRKRRKSQPESRAYSVERRFLRANHS